MSQGLFTRTRVLTHRAHSTASPQLALNSIQDFDAFIALNPLVINAAEDPNQPGAFTITDKVPILFGLSTETKYQCVLKKTAEGMNSEVKAALGLTTEGQWSVLPTDDGGCDIQEIVTLRVNFLLMPFVAKTITDAHNDLMKRFVERLKSLST